MSCELQIYFLLQVSSELISSFFACSFLHYSICILSTTRRTILFLFLFFSFPFLHFFLAKKKTTTEENTLLLYCMLCMTMAICISPYIQLSCMNDGIFFNDRCSINVKSSLFLQIILSKCLKRLEVFREIVLI
jgi:hypothetical protein